MATPFEWMQLIAGCATSALDDSPLGTPDIVEYGDMQSVVDTSCGALYVDAGEVFDADKERWPNRVDPSKQVTSIGRVCDVVPTTNITLLYAHCVPTIADGKARVPSVKRNESAENMWGTAWAVWEGFTCCLPGWRREYGKITRNSLSPLPRQGVSSGFTIRFTVALSNCPDC